MGYGPIEELPEELGEDLMLGFVLVLLLSYSFLIAIPFVPGIEIGISLLVMKGSAVAPFVYGATVIGLMCAFLVGRYASQAWLRTLFADLRLRSACRLMDAVRPLDGEARLEKLRSTLPSWARPLIGGWRYVLLAVVLNVPGNGLVGGGGGIGLVAGMSRLFGFWGTLGAVAVGVAPVPLMVWLFGSVEL